MCRVQSKNTQSIRISVLKAMLTHSLLIKQHWMRCKVWSAVSWVPIRLRVHWLILMGLAELSRLGWCSVKPMYAMKTRGSKWESGQSWSRDTLVASCLVGRIHLRRRVRRLRWWVKLMLWWGSSVKDTVFTHKIRRNTRSLLGSVIHLVILYSINSINLQCLHSQAALTNKTSKIGKTLCKILLINSVHNSQIKSSSAVIS